MKKSMSVCILLSMLFVLLTGCQSPGPEQDLGDTYVPESDNAYSFYLSGLLGSPITESEDAYYFEHDQYLYLKDKKTGKCIPLCNKPDCTHDEQAMNSDGCSNCNAFFANILSLAYYQGNLYIFSTDQTIYEMDASGSTRKELLHLEENASCAMVHRGYLYLSFTDFLSAPEDYSEDTIKDLGYRVERYRLDHWDGKTEIIYEKKGEYGQINTLFAYGNRVYIVGGEGDSAVSYNILDRSVSTMPPGTNSYMALSGENLVYFPPLEGYTGEEPLEELFAAYEKERAVIADREGNIEKETEIPKTYSYLYGFGSLIAADNYIEVAFENIPREERGVRFYDQDGKFIREIKTENDTMPVLGMNDDYLFYFKRGENGEGTELWAIDLHRLDDPDLQGELFFTAEE